ncbi:hypothetical protein [Dickeya zeae]|uniref:hypothetical protein n=1 Tax=Dickeya zeae TaxID=204042 RepID=UPI0003A99803|nr:hypothetical protein [Dickeya zeae]MCA6988112.1 hypothetical protein [Dickeya zeae]UJR53223.1 hypothetical protein J417_03635 [Dickeya zeae MS1]
MSLPISDFRLIWQAHHDTAHVFDGLITTAFYFGIFASSLSLFSDTHTIWWQEACICSVTPCSVLLPL